MADNLLYYMNKKGLSRKDLCKDLDFKYTTVTGWLIAEKYPRIDKIEIMANYFGVSKADLVEEKPTFSTSGFDPPLSQQEIGNIEKYRELTGESQLAVLNMIGLLHNREHGTE